MSHCNLKQTRRFVEMDDERYHTRLQVDSNEVTDSHQQYHIGDIVQICNDLELIKILQMDHGNWIREMTPTLGKTARVKNLFPNKDLMLEVCSRKWRYNPAAVTKLVSALVSIYEINQNGYMDVIQVLLQNGINVDIEDENGDRAVHHAALNDDPGVLKLLTHAGADLNARNGRQETALHIAVKKRKL